MLNGKVMVRFTSTIYLTSTCGCDFRTHFLMANSVATFVRYIVNTGMYVYVSSCCENELPTLVR